MQQVTGVAEAAPVFFQSPATTGMTILEGRRRS